MTGRSGYNRNTNLEFRIGLLEANTATKVAPVGNPLCGKTGGSNVASKVITCIPGPLGGYFFTIQKVPGDGFWDVTKIEFTFLPVPLY